MNIKIHERQGHTIAEVLGDEVYLRDGQDVLGIFAELYGSETVGLILHENQLDPAFFKLRTGVAGDIVQKFANYQMCVAIVGQFAAYQSQAVRDFIYEANKGRLVYFTASLDDALERLVRIAST